MAASSRLSLISPLRLWVVFNALFISLVVSSSYTSYRLAALDNQKLVTSQVVTLTKSRFDDLKNRRFRDFVEGIGSEFGDLYVQVDMGADSFKFGKMPRPRHCGDMAYQLTGSGADGQARVMICRPFKFAVWPILVVLAAYLVISGLAFVLISRLDQRATSTLGEFLRGFGVEVDPKRGLIGIMTEIRSIRNQLEHARTRERTLAGAEARAALAEQVAHDILSPLAALEVAAGDVSQLPEKKRLLIRSAVGRIRDIANSLLEKNRALTTRTEADKTSPSIQLLSGLIQSLITEKRLQFRSRSHVEIEARIDAASYGIFAQFQPVEFKRLLSNLINNAVEALGADQGSVHVNLSARQGRAFVSVQDDGKGISPEVLEKLGRRGETHGKVGGSGLGIYHARTSAESWGGSLEIESEVGKGTTTTVNLPQVLTPEWFVSELALVAGRTVVILDDDVSIHQVWRGRLDALRTNEHDVEIVHVSTPEEIRRWVKANERAAREALYLLDYELLGYQETGLSLAEELSIGDRSILVTNRHEEPGFLEDCRKLKARMIPKGLMGLVPIRVAQQLAGDAERPRTTSKDWDAILIDDDPLVRETWQVAADLAQKRLKVFASADEFFQEAGAYGRDIPVYIDATLGSNSRGEEESRRIHAMGFMEIYLATGQKVEDFSTYGHLRGVVGKGPPWTS